MEITGPVAEESTAAGPAKQGGCLAGCASGCASAVGLLALVITTTVGAAWELTQPHHRASASVPDGSCQLEWWRAATGGARYRITCDAKKDLVLEDFKLLSGPAGVQWNESVEGWGQRPWEDQRPLSGDEVTVEDGRTWTYNGTISMGSVPWVGPEGAVELTVVMDDQKRTFKASE